jgi:hypothetical protein
MAIISPVPKLQFFDKLYSYAAGTTTPLATYTDAGGGTANANPVILDSRGEASVWLGTAAYKLKLTTATDVDVWTVDDVAGAATLAQLAASGGSSLIGFLPAPAGVSARTVQSKLRDVVSVKDFGATGNGATDDTTALLAAAAYVNGIANTNGMPVGLRFPAGTYRYGTSLAFTRPVYLLGEDAATLHYTGTGNGIVLGPTNLSAPNNLHLFYGAFDLGFTGYSTATNILYVGPWVAYPSFIGLWFYNAGSASGYAIRCPYNNWSINVHNCNYFAGGAGWTTQTNFFRADGVNPSDGTTLDFGNSRLNATNNWVRWGGVAVGGIAYYISGAKSRVSGGGSEGAKIAFLLGGWASWTEINGVYDERLFDDASVPCMVQIGAAGDPNNSTDIKGVKLLNIYSNLHNYTDAFTAATTSVFFKNYSDTCKIYDMTVDNIDVNNKKYPLLNFPGTAGGHRIIQGTVNVFGPWEAQTYASLNTMDVPGRARFATQIKNYVANPSFRTWTTNITAAAAPLNTAVATNITVGSDGTGGSRTVTRNTTPVAGTELAILDYEPYFLTLSCATAGTGVTFFSLDFLTSAAYKDVVGQRVVLSFMARAALTTNLTASLAFVHNNAPTAFNGFEGPVVINNSSWRQYSTYLVVPEVPAGTAVATTASVRLLIGLPVGTFACDVGNFFLHVNGVAWPFQVATA